ncbi:MAG TPA: hypothetical protein VGD65_07455 [Chryseosolibacter sp.]
MKISKIALLFAAVIMGQICQAQGGRDSLTMAMVMPHQAIKFSPLHLINFYPTAEFSFEQKVASHVSVQLEAGYVIDYNNDWDEDFLNKRGAKFKIEARYYFFGRADKRKGYYIAGEGYANVVNFDRVRTTTECFDVNCEHPFRRTAEYKIEYREKGFTIKAGLLKRFGRFLFDFNSGLTLRDIRYHEPANLEEQFSEWTFWDIPDERDRVAFSPNFGARFGYVLK